MCRLEGNEFRSGYAYVVLGGARVINEGGTVIMFISHGGHSRFMYYAVAVVNQVLVSVAQFVNP